uniref:FERM domain-containing protein n=1 Tax=Steinernema glaseri TaxID=37863 RepID=A0A1I7Y091_9BILA
MCTFTSRQDHSEAIATMDRVPYAFCDSVASTLKKLPKSSLSGVWGAALEDHRSNRKTLSLTILLKDNAWSYSITSEFTLRFQRLSLEEVLKIRAKYLEITHIEVTDSLRHVVLLPATEEKILRVVQLAKSLSKGAEFSYLKREREPTALDDHLNLYVDFNAVRIDVQCYPVYPEHFRFVESMLKREQWFKMKIYGDRSLRKEILKLLQKEDKHKYKRNVNELVFVAATMDTVPYAFCDAVFSTLSELPRRRLGNAWDAVLVDHSRNRRVFYLKISLVDGRWFYCIECKARGWHNFGHEKECLSFDELLRVPRKYLRFTYFLMTDCPSVVHYPSWKQSSEEETRRIVKFAVKFAQGADFKISLFDGRWSYCIECKARGWHNFGDEKECLSFDELLRIPRKYLRFTYFHLSDCGNTPAPPSWKQSSEEELRRIVKFAVKSAQGANFKCMKRRRDPTQLDEYFGLYERANLKSVHFVVLPNAQQCDVPLLQLDRFLAYKLREGEVERIIVQIPKSLIGNILKLVSEEMADAYICRDQNISIIIDRVSTALKRSVTQARGWDNFDDEKQCASFDELLRIPRKYLRFTYFVMTDCPSVVHYPSWKHSSEQEIRRIVKFAVKFAQGAYFKCIKRQREPTELDEYCSLYERANLKSVHFDVRPKAQQCDVFLLQLERFLAYKLRDGVVERVVIEVDKSLLGNILKLVSEEMTDAYTCRGGIIGVIIDRVSTASKRSVTQV